MFSCFLSGLFYFIVLGESGIVVRSQLEESLASLQLDIERLSYENRQLEEKQKILKTIKLHWKEKRDGFIY
ncbi:septum formation initiator [Leptospira interrogans serovar Grippotyphosa str. LT2186]|uniref:Septum formation initiator n=1 Tax=Leptospira interrogans serovar Grippotyphosa str. LT2186 TaxID=1001599 RepID=M3I1R2_LEPIR|nr:septum formation initiator [Leptospira interrogans serovar Grippotyphosa str. LT2186]